MIDQIISKLTERSILSLLTLLSAVIAKAAHTVLLAPLQKGGRIEELALMTAASLGLSFLSLSYVIYLKYFKKKKLASDNYTFNDKVGHYIHKKSGQRVCTSCLVSGIESPLQTFDHGWACLRNECKRQYVDPENPPPPPQRKNSIPSKYLSETRRW